MSKQDRQGVRKPADIEQKYNLGQLSKISNDTSKQTQQISALSQTLSQYMVSTNGKLEDLENEIDEVEAGAVTITSITESTEDGGENVVTFSDGNTLTVKNGSKGSDGGGGGNVWDTFVLLGIVELLGSQTDFFIGANGSYLTDGGSTAIVSGDTYVLIMDGVEYSTVASGTFATFSTDGFHMMVGLYSGTDKLWMYSSTESGKTFGTVEFYHKV